MKDIVKGDEGAIALSPTNIIDNRISYEKSNTTFISLFKYEESPEIKIYEGDIVFVKTGSTVGKVAYVDNVPLETTLNPQLVVLKDIKCNSFFLSCLLETTGFQNKIRRITVGGAVPTLSQSAMGALTISVPSRNEQAKIAELLSLINKRIIIQNKVIEKYESLIKALAYENMGKHKPNITLSECVLCSSSSIKENELAKRGSVPTYGASGVSGFMANALSEGDSILITKDGSGVGSLRYVSGPHSFVGTLNSMTPKEGIYLPYIYYALQNVCFESYRAGLAIPHIYFRDYSKEAIYCPAYEDQKHLAKGLEMIDTKIGYERAVLQNLLSAKKYFLSALFI